MERFRSIQPLQEVDIQLILQKVQTHSLMQAMLHYGFPDLECEHRNQILMSCNSVSDFQKKIMYHIVQTAKEKTIQEFTVEGFEFLHPEKAYLFISNHRDIILDTSLLNLALHDKGLSMTASAIGDNLVQKKFLLRLAMLNRNFIIHRKLPIRETLIQSQIVSQYIRYCIREDSRSVWIAQREGRTKDGNDQTQQGVLKMLSLAKDSGQSALSYLKQLNIVPVAISYEFDPTDKLKMPALMAEYYGEHYEKRNKEDLENIIRGLIGQKGRVHICVRKPLSEELDHIEANVEGGNKQFQALADLIDRSIYKQYKLWPANYIAYDLLNQSSVFEAFYTDKQVRQFERRLSNRADSSDKISQEKYLQMYANPVINRLKIQ